MHWILMFSDCTRCDAGRTNCNGIRIRMMIGITHTYDYTAKYKWLNHEGKKEDK